VATLASIAAAGGPGDSLTGLVDGFNHGFVVAGSVAALVAAVAAFALPSVRPEPGMAHGMH
jgi:ABC-type proline/glycine betaine transport system permease subunit